MNTISGNKKAASVQAMFTRIARRYDLMNRLMTAGLDVRWRRQVIRLASPPRGGRLLDVGTGSGDLAAQALQVAKDICVVGGDFTLAMMRQGRQRRHRERVRWAAMDALLLPFPAATFDAVTSGYLLRNVSDVPSALAEQYRVLRPGGTIVCLDTTRPSKQWYQFVVDFYINTIIPLLGALLTGEREAYTYLPESTAGFLSAEQLGDLMSAAGFQKVGFKRLAGNTMALHWGCK
jgi:demethylmenaquinone methyltransferase/2-methoxy-6-polyprenyl-1,4-benzoquinol methylase